MQSSSLKAHIKRYVSSQITSYTSWQKGAINNIWGSTTGIQRGIPVASPFSVTCCYRSACQAQCYIWSRVSRTASLPSRAVRLRNKTPAFNPWLSSFHQHLKSLEFLKVIAHKKTKMKITCHISQMIPFRLAAAPQERLLLFICRSPQKYICTTKLCQWHIEASSPSGPPPWQAGLWLLYPACLQYTSLWAPFHKAPCFAHVGCIGETLRSRLCIKLNDFELFMNICNNRMWPRTGTVDTTEMRYWSHRECSLCL